jgi:hypothetical protein
MPTRRVTVLLAATVSCVLGGVASARATAICVGGPGCFATIQAAVDAAHDGDTIRIGRGSYGGGVTIGVSIALVGSGAGATIVRGGGPVLTIGTPTAPRPNVSISGITVTGGANTSTPESFFAAGGGISVPQAPDGGPGATVTVRDSIVAGNSATPSAIFPSPSGVVCGGGTFCPYAQGEGGGIFNGGTMTLTNVTVSDNVAGGALASDADAAGISNLPGAVLVLVHCVVRGNVARAPAPNGRFAEGAGIFARHDSTLRIDDSIVSGNRADLVVAQNVLSGGPLAQAAGIRIGPGASASIAGTEISGNVVTAASLYGDAVAFSGGVHADGDLVLRNSVVEGNRVSASVPAGSHAGAFADSGAGELNSDVIVSGTRFAGNTVEAAAPDGSAWAVAGAILTSAADGATIDSSAVIGNRIDGSTSTGDATVEGGGLVNMGVLALRTTLVSGNRGTASGPAGVLRGGGIWNGRLFPDGPPDVELTLVAAPVTLNALVSSGAVHAAGGGIFAELPVTLQRSPVALNWPDQCTGC